MICRNCGESAPEKQRYFVRGLCNACRIYEQRHGQPRPAQGIRMTGGAVGICENCRQGRARYRHLCGACHAYWLENGRQRPRRLYLRPQECRNCHVPRSAVRHLEKGRCPSCGAFWRRTGRERPQHYWESPSGYCECGQPVAHVGVELAPMGTFDLCAGCYGLEIG